MIRFYIAAAAALASIGAAAQSTLDFSYNTAGEQPRGYGFHKLETYDVAIRIQNPSFTGARIIGMYVTIPGTAAQITDCSGWLSTDLRLENKVNAPDIASKAGVIDDHEMLYITFDEPYTIPAEGVYVGYSMTVTELQGMTEAPVAVVYGTDPNGFFIHSSRSQRKWASYVDRFDPGAVSAMVVQLEGDFSADAAAARLPQTSFVEVNRESTFSLTVVNSGSKPVSGIDYSWSADEWSGFGSYTFPTQIEGHFGASATASLPLPTLERLGTYPFTVKIDRVNGVENRDAGASASAELTVVPFIPVNRPLVEEYTGLWCGNCPRGYVTLEEMNELYGEQFVALAWHNGDPMAVTDDYPSYVSGFPTAYINRASEIDPTDIPGLFPQVRAEIPLADIDVALEWNADGTVLTATSTTRFVKDVEWADYAVAYVLVQDGMKGDTWVQSNYYAGDTTLTGKYWDLFTQGKSGVVGLTYNDVAIAYTTFEGVDGSLPEVIAMDTAYEHSCSFRPGEVLNQSGDPLLQNPDNLRVVAMIIDRTTGRPINCNSSAYADGRDRPESGIRALATEASVSDISYYDLQGRRVMHPVPGLYLRVETLTDGTRRTVRHLVR